jgi:ABC-type Mn2+/Zn2+ transport system permease subunit
VLAMLITLALLSRRFGKVTKATPYYLGFFAAAVLVLLAMATRIYVLWLAQKPQIYDNTLWTLVYHGLMASGIVIALFAAWRYWSWLFAERD